MAAFFTRERANEGIEVPMYYPNGELSPHKLRIRGVDSDEYRAAYTEMQRKLMEKAAEKDGAPPDRTDITLDLLVSLVKSWTFEVPCTPENVRNFFREAPQLADSVSKLATRRSAFFVKKPDSSSST